MISKVKIENVMKFNVRENKFNFLRGLYLKKFIWVFIVGYMCM